MLDTVNIESASSEIRYAGRRKCRRLRAQHCQFKTPLPLPPPLRNIQQSAERSNVMPVAISDTRLGKRSGMPVLTAKWLKGKTSKVRF